MIEFEAGDKVVALETGNSDDLVIGSDYTIETLYGDGTCAVEERGNVYSNTAFRLATPKYRHGDVYECDSMCDVVVTVDGSGSAVSKAHIDQHAVATAYARQACGGVKPERFGKFLYNVFDKESADSDCDTSDIAELIAECEEEIEKEDNTKEAIMPITITTPTMLNGSNIESFTDEQIGGILRDTITEAIAAETLAKESKSSKLKATAAKIRKDIAALTKLLDDRTES